MYYSNNRRYALVAPPTVMLILVFTQGATSSTPHIHSDSHTHTASSALGGLVDGREQKNWMERVGWGRSEIVVRMS